MIDELSTRVSYLHDALVHSIDLTIDNSGNRLLKMLLHCHPDCGFVDWNDKELQVEFLEPLVVHSELYGHMANAEEVNSFDFVATDKMSDSIRYLTDAGIARPSQVASVVFQSGSQLDVACQQIRVSDCK